jgi:CRP/FNR family transcriptional regulator, cyclic AMP receptor protein
MRTPYNLNVQPQCSTCKVKKAGWFCDTSSATVGDIDTMKFTAVYPKGSVLFVEGESARGVFMLCSGRVKLTTSSSEGRTLIVGILEPGEVLGVSASVLNTPYEVSAETLEPAQVNFINREDFMRLLSSHSDASMRAAQLLSTTVQNAQREIRSLGLSQTTSEKLARLILNWCEDRGEETPNGTRVQVLLTHEEIAQMIGTTRETVTRILSEFKRNNLLEVKGANFFVPESSGLHDIVTV